MRRTRSRAPLAYNGAQQSQAERLARIAREEAAAQADAEYRAAIRAATEREEAEFAQLVVTDVQAAIRQSFIPVQIALWASAVARHIAALQATRKPLADFGEHVAEIIHQIAPPCAGYTLLDAAELKAALDKLTKCAGHKSTLPVLQHVLLDAQPGRLLLAATDLEQALQIGLATKGAGRYSVCVPLARMRELLATAAGLLSLTYEPARIEQGDMPRKIPGAFVIRKQGAGTIRIKEILPGDEFPTIPAGPASHWFRIDASAFCREIERIARCAATDEARPVFTGILFQTAPGTSTLAAADSYRLGYSLLRLRDVERSLDALLPAKCMTTLCSLLPKQADVHFFARKNADAASQIVATWGSCRYVCRVIDGAFPAWQRIVPPDAPAYNVAVDARHLQETTAHLHKIAEKECGGIVRYGWNTSKQQLIADISCETVEQEEYLPASIPEPNQPSKSRFMMVNGRYIVDACKGLTGKVSLNFWAPQKPMTICSATEEDTAHTVMVMPMHTLR